MTQSSPIFGFNHAKRSIVEEVTQRVCDSCKDRLRQEAMGGQSKDKHAADKSLRKHGVTPKSGS